MIHLLIDFDSSIAFKGQKTKFQVIFNVTNHSRQSPFLVDHLENQDGVSVNFRNQNRTISGRNLKKCTR